MNLPAANDSRPICVLLALTRMPHPSARRIVKPWLESRLEYGQKNRSQHQSLHWPLSTE